MKRSYAVILAFVLCALTVPFSAYGVVVDPPHFGATSDGISTDTSCSTCHTSHLTLGSTGYNNICQSCHRAGDPAAGKKPLTLADAANPFNNHTSHGLTKRYQTSHRWDGSDTVPEAGALPPTLPNLTTANLRGRSGNELACVRCHNQHDNSNGKFLRTANNQDQLCMDCHRTRNVQSHLQGSHPVGVAMPPASKSFNNPPLNANPANPTSDLNAQLTVSGGVVICSTCHGVHFTDSRSSTVDGGANFANLSTGDGYLLRTDHRGAAVAQGVQDNLNICTNCHADKKNHNVKGQNIQCVDCHGAHVEYDPNDPTNTKGTNISLIRRNVIKNNQPSQIFYRYTGSAREYKTPLNTGVCQGCHDVPAPGLSASGASYPSQHASNDPKVCNSCHYHNNVTGSFSGACRGCHGFPPSDSTVIGGPNGLAAPPTNAGGSVGAHVLHAQTRGMDCSTCHNGYANRPMPNGSIDLGFAIDGINVPGFKNHDQNGNYTNTNALGTNTQGGAYSWTGPVSTTGVPSQSTCTNVYCHGATLTGGTNKNSVSWVGGSNESSCGACHGVYGNPPSTGSHIKHANVKAGTAALSCDYCHGPHPDNSHVNGAVEWNFTLDPLAQYKPANGSFSNSGATTTLAPSPTYGQCTNIYCHSSAQGPTGTGPITYQSPTWGQVGPLGCGACHVNMASDPTATGSHVKHAQVNAIGCSTCHNGYTSLTTGSKHADGNIDVLFPATGISAGSRYSKTSSFAPGSAYGSCSTSYCHSNSRGSYPVTPPAWGVANSMSCGSCHDDMSTTSNTNGGHRAHASIANTSGPQYGCTACHSSYPSLHVNQSVDLTFDATATTTYSKVTPMSPGAAWGTCSASKCHGQATGISWGGSIYKAGNDSCSTCHSSDAVGSVANATPFYSTEFPGVASKQTLTANTKVGVHTTHMASSMSLTRPLVCGDCHGAVTMKSPSHMNGTTDFAWSQLASGAAANGTPTIVPSYDAVNGCLNYCHGAKMPLGDTSGTGNGLGSHPAPKWTDTSYLPNSISVAACGTCHGLPPRTGSTTSNHSSVPTPTTVAEIGTICSGCHPNVNLSGNSYDTIFKDKTLHINGFIEGGGACDSCHGYPPAKPAFVGTQNNWSAARLEDYQGSGGMHTTSGHVNKNVMPIGGFANCAPCHNQSDHQPGSGIANANQNVKVGIESRVRFNSALQPKYSSNRLAGVSHITGRCSNVACHFQKSPQW